MYNISDTSTSTAKQATYAHIVGNGTSTSKRSNAHTLDWSGNAWFAGDVYVGSTSGKNKDTGSKRLARVDELLQVEILETPKDGEILVYDATSNKLVNSGFTFASLKQWVKEYIELYMSTTAEENAAGGETLDINTNNYTEENGTLTIGG